MTKLERLIKEICPDGTPRYLISDICDVTRGRVMSKDYIRENEGDYPVYSSQTENNGELGRISTYDFDGEYLTWTTDGANAGTVFYRNEKFNITNVCGLLKIKVENILTKYVYYVLSVEALKYVNSGMGNPKLMSNTMARIKIPIPPLPVQREIVRILDNFTELTTELTAELTARRKQYEYYRTKILKLSQKSELKKLGNICRLVRGPFGGSLKKEIFTKSGYAVYEQQHAIYGNFEFRYFIDERKFKELKRFAVSSGDLIMSCSGTMGKISIIPDNAPAGIINQALLKLTPNPNVNNKYLKYCFEDSISSQMNTEARGGAIKNVASVSELKEIEVSIPPLEEQDRIVSILDRFDALCNDLTSGLPAEIEARKKQYEYYRDKLLTFQELK